ncbi:hypothetical protein R1sor_020899 [Riccia sorocarpa]|uniref:Myb/SANT-like DNA-binding domain-containing protein n=1 Tax=Riccia sorocarpa TaxID=122646 RepID=A0ABD3GFI9_9MARC
MNFNLDIKSTHLRGSAKGSGGKPFHRTQRDKSDVRSHFNQRSDYGLPPLKLPLICPQPLLGDRGDAGVLPPVSGAALLPHFINGDSSGVSTLPLSSSLVLPSTVPLSSVNLPHLSTFGRSPVLLPFDAMPSAASPVQKVVTPSTSENSGKTPKPRLEWEDWSTLLLTEVRREEEIEAESRGRKDWCEKSDGNWVRIARKMKLRGVDADRGKIKNKWESLTADYKIISDSMKQSGSRDYFEMSKEERNELKLPKNFLKEWFLLMDSFLGKKPNMRSACTADNLDPLPPQGPMEDTAVSRRPKSATETEAVYKSSSGIQRRKEIKSSEGVASLISEVVAVEKEKLEFMRAAQQVRMAIAKDQVQCMREQSQKIRGALDMMVQSLDRIATSLLKIRTLLLG